MIETTRSSTLTPSVTPLKSAQEVLRRHMGFESFRPGQEAVIRDLLSGRDTLAVMPTGGGKSVCYQVPGLVFQGITLVISPLISLMRDQVSALRAKNIAAGAIHSGQDRSENAKIFQELRQASTYLLYVSPERVQSEGFAKWLENAPVRFIAIDEAHCVSQWGHDFREDYGKLSRLRELKPYIPILATTATATPQVLRDIAKQLGLKDPARHVYGFYRPNLYYQVALCKDEDDRKQMLEEAILQSREGRVIVYVGTRRTCEALAKDLQKGVEKVGFYHAGLSHEARTQVQEEYDQGDIRILIATNAFGMGVDQPNVRTVVHYNMPANIESYYQEAGRAGRDGDPATCLMLYLKKDYGLQAYFIKESQAPSAIVSNRWKSLEAMVQFCESAECRHAGILTYFRDTQRLDDCGHCDVCDPQGKQRLKLIPGVVGRLARKAKAGVRRLLETQESHPSTPLDEAMVAKLRNWRKDYAKAHDVPAFVVFSDKTLSDLVKKRPKTLDELLKVYGVGNHKMKQFGEELLRVLHA